MDKAEKARRDELLDQMYRSTGSGTPAKPAEPAKPEEGEVYVPLGAGGDSGGGDMGGGGGGEMEPPPMEPPPMEPEPPMGDDG